MQVENPPQTTAEDCACSDMVHGRRFPVFRAALCLAVLVGLQGLLALPASLAREGSLKSVIVLDPGHGGHDAGAVGPSGLAEKNVTLSVALKIKEILSGDFEVYLTRDGDYEVDVERRTAFANHRHADVFLSIHGGGAFGQSPRGITTLHYGLGPAGGQAFSQKEGRSWEQQTLLTPWNDLWTRHANQSEALANMVHKSLLALPGAQDRGVREAPLFVLRGADMPAVLVEIGYLTHPGEEAALEKPETLSLRAEAISYGIVEFLMNGE